MSQSRARRMQEQSWMYDRLIRFGGPDFYWPMTQEVLNASGMTGWGDVMSVRAGVRRLADLTREKPGAKAAVERSNPGPCLPEARIIGCNRKVAADVENMAAADCEACDHRDNWLRAAPHLNLQVEHVEAPDSLLRHLVVADVSVIAADSLIAAGAESQIALAGEDDHTHVGVVLSPIKGFAQLK